MTLLEAEGIRARHGARVVLDEVGLTLATGDRVAVVGANGSGKSTLLRALLGLEPSAHGEVRLGGRSLATMSRGEIARAATLVLQDTHVDVPITVRELVALGRYPHRGVATAARDRDAIARALAHAELEPLADRDVRTLSGGELQRAHLARALAQETPVVLLDEPTASLDLHHQLHTLATLGALAAEGRAVLVVLHDLALAARWAERIVVLGGGRVLAEGAPERVLTPATIHAAFGVEARVERVGGSLVVIPDDAK